MLCAGGDACAAVACNHNHNHNHNHSHSHSRSLRRLDPMHREEGQDALHCRLAVGAEGAFDEMMAGPGEHVDLADLIRGVSVRPPRLAA